MSYQKQLFMNYLHDNNYVNPGSYCNGLDNVEKFFLADIDEEFDKDECYTLYDQVHEARKSSEMIGKNEHDVRTYASKLKKYIEFRQGQKTGVKLLDKDKDNTIRCIISEYKKNFNRINSEEIYKWKAVGFYKNNWNINAEDFGSMVELAFSRYKNLLSGGRYYAYAALVEFAKAEPEKAREAFKHLYDESLSIANRFDDFRNVFNNHFMSLNKSHYQDLHAISIYLASEYPESYFFYKYGVLKNYIDILKLDIDLNRVPHETDKLRISNELCNEIRDVVCEDSALTSMLYNKLDGDCYPDSNCCMLAFDVMYYTANKQKIKIAANLSALETPINQYIIDFKDRWNADKSKWEAVQTFHDNWDIEANDFSAMFNRATNSSSFISLSSGIPKRTFVKLAAINPTAVKSLFALLFDESTNIEDRCNEFYETLSNMISDKDIYLQDRSLAVYLFLRYPEKYYVYRPNELLSIEKIINGRYAHLSGSKVQKMLKAYELYDAIRELFNNYTDFIDEYNHIISSENLSDESLCILVSDFASFIREKSEVDDFENMVDDDAEETALVVDEWWPSLDEYNPHITKEGWIKYLSEIEIPSHPSPMQMLKAMWELGGEASCKKISCTYGGSPNRYVGCAMNLGRRVKKYYNLPACMDGNQERFFSFPFQGKMGDDGDYIYKLRPELFGALDEIDLTNISAAYDSSRGDFEPYTKQDFLKDVYITEEKYNTCVSRLKHKMNLILQGAPGVGKTYAARRLAWSIMGVKDDNRVELVQFHQSYSYEDFLMGYKPVENGFRLEKGVFFEFCIKAKDDPYNDYFFIIDEINRGNMSKIFGELLMLIESDYRDNEIKLAYSKKAFSIPRNLYIIGMMNTADRSLAMIDYALRRRFSFVEIRPGFESEGFSAYQSRVTNPKFGKLIARIRALNSAIESDSSLGKGFCIGHSYFCNLDVNCNDSVLKEIVEYDIIPMLEEYWFDDDATVKSWSSDLRGVFYE